MHKKRLQGFYRGKPKKDPLFESHQLQETLSKKRLSTLQTLSRAAVGGGHEDSLNDISPRLINQKMDSEYPAQLNNSLSNKNMAKTVPHKMALSAQRLPNIEKKDDTDKELEKSITSLEASLPLNGVAKPLLK